MNFIISISADGKATIVSSTGVTERIELSNHVEHGVSERTLIVEAEEPETGRFHYVPKL